MKLLSKKQNSQTKSLRFLGIPVFKAQLKNDIEKKYLFGIPFSKKIISMRKNELLKQLKNNISQNYKNMFFANSVAYVHRQSFKEYQNCFSGKNIWLFACGPSLKEFTHAIPSEDICIGVNKAFLAKDIIFNFLFVQDKNVGKEALDKMLQYQKRHKTKIFAGIVNKYEISQSFALEAKASRYYTDFCITNDYSLSELHYDICNYPLGDFHSVAFSAMQFILWTNPAKIYLVGCDCTTNGYFNDKTKNYLPDDIVEEWIVLKKFAQKHYPETDIISVNPRGLKGVFKDMYTTKKKEI